MINMSEKEKVGDRIIWIGVTLWNFLVKTICFLSFCVKESVNNGLCKIILQFNHTRYNL